jgi:hypothetical protein
MDDKKKIKISAIVEFEYNCDTKYNLEDSMKYAIEKFNDANIGQHLIGTIKLDLVNQ